METYGIIGPYYPVIGPYYPVIGPYYPVIGPYIRKIVKNRIRKSKKIKKGVWGGLDRCKRMAEGQLRFWAAGKLAYESEAWPQAFFFWFVLHPFLGKQPKLNVLTKHRSKIA